MRQQLTTRANGWAARHADHYPERNPKLIILLLATGLSLLTVATGDAPSSATHPVLSQFAAAGVSLGCFACIAGLLVPWRDLGLQIEIAGCIVLGSALLAYGWTAGLSASAPSRIALTYGLGIGSYARAVQIGLYVRGRILNRRAEVTGSDR